MELSKLQKEYGHSLNPSVTIAMAIWNSSCNLSFLKDGNPQYEANIRISLDKLPLKSIGFTTLNCKSVKQFSYCHFVFTEFHTGDPFKDILTQYEIGQ